MDIKTLEDFISRDALKAHLEYVRGIRLRHSVSEKCYPELKDRSWRELASLPLKKEVKNNAIAALSELELHDVFFNSFTRTPRPSSAVRRYYGSEDAFCYELIEAGLNCKCGFVYVTRDLRGRPILNVIEDFGRLPSSAIPLLSVDVCEHAYFTDYGFDKNRYLRSAAARLDLARLDLKK